MLRAIAGFERDGAQDWVAVLECGHRQHVRHNPPWEVRPWTATPEGRQQMLGHTLMCKLCDTTERAADAPEPDEPAS